MEALITRWAERPAVVGGKTAGPLPYETWDEFVARM
jgi:hypothetical protein